MPKDTMEDAAERLARGQGDTDDAERMEKRGPRPIPEEPTPTDTVDGPAEEEDNLTFDEMALAVTWAADILTMSERDVANKFVQMVILHKGNLNKIVHTFEIMLTAHTLARTAK